jgi:hypothetical protein
MSFTFFLFCVGLALQSQAFFVFKINNSIKAGSLAAKAGKSSPAFSFF